jgi:hypothetical protein
VGQTGEKLCPYVVGVAASVPFALYYVLRRTPLPEGATEALVVLVSVSAIAIGFIATAKMILLTVPSNKAVRQLREAGLFNLYMRYMMEAITWCFIVAGIAGVLLFLFRAMVTPLPAVGYTLVVFSSATAAARSYQVIHIFSKLLQGKP